MREAKGKGERERYTQLNAEFQRIARRDKKTLSKQCKEIKKTIEQERLKISSRKRDTKATVYANMGTIKDRNGEDLTEAEDIKKQQEYTEELHKKGLNDADKNDSVVTHLEPDILESEVK